jgi:hypothetical protein
LTIPHGSKVFLANRVFAGSFPRITRQWRAVKTRLLLVARIGAGGKIKFLAGIIKWCNPRHPNFRKTQWETNVRKVLSFSVVSTALVAAVLANTAIPALADYLPIDKFGHSWTGPGVPFDHASAHCLRPLKLDIITMTCRTGSVGDEPEEKPTQGSVYAYCARVVTDDDPGMVPTSLEPAFQRAFEFSGPVPREGLRFRCYQGTVVGCSLGANLNCGKANTSRTSGRGNEWCRAHPNERDIPMAVTGHDTIYEWSCSGTRAVPGRKFSPVDDRGFEMMNWQVLN